jgi:lipoprotein-anchoring transpeptidase ErfK/SrfK
MSRHTACRAGRHRAATSLRDTRVAAAMTVTAAAVGATFPGPVVADAAPSDDTSQNAAATEHTAAAREAHTEAEVPGTPCSVSARACVDLDSQRVWLIDDGQVVRGPMKVTTGARGYETPIGHSFRVYRQEADHVSQESRTPDGRPSPMPYSTFFADGGIAFHGGNLNRASAGCIHLDMADAEAVYDALGVGDKVQVVRASRERAARHAAD